MIQFNLYCYFSVDLIINGCSLIQLLRVFSGLFMPSVVMLERAHLVARVSSHSLPATESKNSQYTVKRILLT